DMRDSLVRRAPAALKAPHAGCPSHGVSVRRARPEQDADKPGRTRAEVQKGRLRFPRGSSALLPCCPTPHAPFSASCRPRRPDYTLVMSDGAPLVGLIMGSQSDWETMAHAAEVLTRFAVPHERRVVSAHRTPEWMAEYARTAEARGLEVI